MDIETIKVSKHASERYAERIMGKSGSDVTLFINTQGDKILTDIKKMLAYANMIYKGVSLQDRNKYNCEIYLSGTWILFVSTDNNQVVTLYKIDLGLGEEFNKEYVNKLLERLQLANSKLNEVMEETNQRKVEIEEQIGELGGKIKELRTVIQQYEQQIEGNRLILAGLEADRELADVNVKEIISTVVGKRIY